MTFLGWWKSDPFYGVKAWPPTIWDEKVTAWITWWGNDNFCKKKPPIVQSIRVTRYPGVLGGEGMGHKLQNVRHVVNWKPVWWEIKLKKGHQSEFWWRDLGDVFFPYKKTPFGVMWHRRNSPIDCFLTMGNSRATRKLMFGRWVFLFKRMFFRFHVNFGEYI